MSHPLSTPFLLLLAAASVAPAEPPPERKKLIATGWDSPTPAQYRSHLSEFERWPFDGTTIQPTRRIAGGKTADAKFAFSRERWDRSEFEEVYAVSAKVLRQGRGFAGVTVRWKDAAGRWTAETRDVGLTPLAGPDAEGWREYAAAVGVPESAAELVLLLGARDQKSPADAAWFDEARVVPMDRENPSPGRG